MYPNCRIYGPYTRKDGRQHIIAVSPNGKKKTVSYSKYLVECYLGRYLKDNETVDHIDRDFTNNSMTNLRVLARTKHAEEDAIRCKPMQFICPICGREFELSGRKLTTAIANSKRGKSGPYCSRQCAGKYGASVAITKKKAAVVEIIPEYTTNKSLQGLDGEIYQVEGANSGKS